MRYPVGEASATELALSPRAADIPRPPLSSAAGATCEVLRKAIATDNLAVSKRETSLYCTMSGK
jgi:hypothetical protein